jgi:hypothetical protein
MAKTLRPSKAPNIPIAPVAYDQRYSDQLMNALRLYFNQVDNVSSSLLSNDGGRFLNFPNIFVSSPDKQYATGDDVPTIVSYGTPDKNQGFTITSTTISPNWSGAYRIDYRLLFENSDVSTHTVYVWLKINSADADHSAAKFSTPIIGYVMASGFIELDLIGKDVIEIYWATDKAANTTGPVNGVWMDAYPASISPYNRPSIPSSYVAVTFVSELS